MGMTYWLNVRDGDVIESEQSDLSCIENLTDELDGLCRNLNVIQISEFVDSTELQREYSENLELPEVDQDTYDEGKRPYSLDEMKWQKASEGVTTFAKLIHHIKHNPEVLKRDSETLHSLLEEMAEVKIILEKAVKAGHPVDVPHREIIGGRVNRALRHVNLLVS
jgi:hypothetical protein